MKTSMTIVFILLIKSPTGNCPCKCDGKSVNKLSNMKGSLQLKNGWLEVVALVALFLFRTGTCDAKNS